MSWLDIDRIFFSVLGYPMSYVEFFGTLAGLVAVWLSARGSAISWPLGIINVILLFFLFYQIHLYPDMFLQVFFFVTNIIGWWRWKNPRAFEANDDQELRISFLSTPQRLIAVGMIVIGTLVLGGAAARLNIWVPLVFKEPGSFPYADAFVTVVSILAQYWMVHKKADCWIMWIAADMVATVLYFMKDVRFLALEYLVFCFIAAHGYLVWKRKQAIEPN